MEMQPFLISRINFLIIDLCDIYTEDFELVREEELCCCEANAGGAAGDDGYFSKASAVDGTLSERARWIVVGEGHFVYCGTWLGWSKKRNKKRAMRCENEILGKSMNI